jgi:hypothetical protein
MLATPEKSPQLVLAEVRDYAELHEALRARVEQLSVSRQELDRLTGLQSGYCSKLLAPTRIKNVGAQSLGPLLCVLGLKLLVAEDPAALARFGPRRQKRIDASVRMPTRRRPKRVDLDSAWGKRMAALRVLTQTPCERSRIARLAAVGRWLKWRDIKEATRAFVKPKPKAMTRQAREARLALDRKPSGGAYSNQP